MYHLCVGKSSQTHMTLVKTAANLGQSYICSFIYDLFADRNEENLEEDERCVSVLCIMDYLYIVLLQMSRDLYDFCQICFCLDLLCSQLISKHFPYTDIGCVVQT